MDNLRAKIFKYRSYTPIPFLILMIVFQEPSLYSVIAGLIIAFIGESIRFWGVGYAGSETRTTGSVGGSQLVISGPFGFVRNPLYVGNICMYVGIGVMSFALFPYLQIIALIYFVFQYKLIVDGEENYLKKQFGKDYSNYFQNVPRFIPRLTRYKVAGYPQPEFSFAAALKSETRTLQAFVFVILIILIKFLFI